MHTTPRHQWQEIEDLPADFDDLSQPELLTLGSIWEEQRAELQARDAVQEFNEKLLRRWAIETGIIERVYTLDRGVTQLLVEHGLQANLIPHHATDRDPEVVIQIIRDQYAAVEGLFDFVAARRELSTSYIKELHALLTSSQATTEAVNPLGQTVQVPLDKGKYKLRPNNPRRPDGLMHEYCPPEHVAAEMDRLIQMHIEHEVRGVSPEVEAAWLHHRFTQIHPFQDGNGRVARALATLVFLRAQWLPLVITDDHRKVYIDALERADAGDLRPLVELFARIEKRQFLEALSVAQEVRDHDRRIKHAVTAIRDVLATRHASLRKEWDGAKGTARHLWTVANDEFDNLSAHLTQEIAPLAPPSRKYSFFVDRDEPNGARSHWFRYQIIQTARGHGYFANPGAFHCWVRLAMETDGRSEILISFHVIGHEFRGVLVATACYFRRDISDENESGAVDVTGLTDEPFQINYRESVQEAEVRFRRWLDEVTVTGLEMFRRSL